MFSGSAFSGQNLKSITEDKFLTLPCSFQKRFVSQNCLRCNEVMLISNFRSNSLKKKRVSEKSISKHYLQNIAEAELYKSARSFRIRFICENYLFYKQLMLISISKYNPLAKIRCLEIPFAEIICKTLLKPISRVLSVLSKMVSFVKIASHIRKLS